jgi:hypothetical protein
MENTAILLIVLTNIFLVIILGILTFIIFKLFKNQSNKNIPEEIEKYHPDILARMKEMKGAHLQQSNLFCPNHKEEPGEAPCAICDKLFCKSCIRPFKSLHFCKEHLQLIMHNEWEEVLTLKTSTQFPEEGVKLYESKKFLFEESHIPTYIETHYKINIDQDYIETYLVLFSIKENTEAVRSKLSE